METADEWRSDPRDRAIVALSLEFTAVLLGVLAVVLLVVAGTAFVRVIIADVHDLKQGDDHILAVSTVSTPQTRGDSVMPVGHGGSGGAGAVEEGKGFYAGRPLFKVPPSSPCRAKAERC